MSAEALERRIRKALRSSRKGPLKPKELAKTLSIPADDYREFRDVLTDMEGRGVIYRVKGQRYAVPEKINLRVGILQITRDQDGFVVSEGSARDIYVPGAFLGSAMDGDQVVVRVEGTRRGRNPHGRIIKILNRAHTTVVGTYRASSRFGSVEPLNARLFRELLIPDGEEGDAREGDIVVARITTYGERRLSPLGSIERVLGPATEPGVDVLAILFGYGLDLEFPDEVEEEAQAQAARDPASVWEGRIDRTALHVFTIDPSDARDHDDALSVESAESGGWEVGIHIADVSAYVEQGSPLDMEAYRRGTSVYLVDRVVPMLPHVLSSDLCSLRPDADRAAVSLFVTIDDQTRIRGHRFERTRIRSRQRLDYQQVQAVLEGNGTVDGKTDGDLLTLANLAARLRRKRMARGSLDFDLPEARVILDPDGEPVDIQKSVQLESHRLIEDFMLLANETVAKEAARRKLPIPYRIHEPPPRDRLSELRRFLGTLGYRLPAKQVTPKDLQRILAESEGKPESTLVSTLILRSMARARYQSVNLGHFGLGAERYTHFTSPIRRYPDLLVHRVVVKALIEGQPVPKAWGGDALAQACDRSTLREGLAADAERDSVALKKAEFMERHLGEVFTGTVSSVTAFGFFVLLDQYYVEGLVHVNSLMDDYYTLKEHAYALVGERTGRRFRLGDSLSVQVSRVNRLERKIDFVLAGP